MGSRIVCHLADANVDSPYFRNIARYASGEFRIVLGSLAPAGALQRAMAELETPTYSLAATTRLHYPLAIVRLARLLRSRKVDLMHAHGFDSTFVAASAASLARVPFVYTRHHSDHIHRLGKPWHVRLDRWCAARAARVIAVSAATKLVMVQREAVAESKITVVYNGVERLTQDPDRVLRLRAELGVSDRPVIVVIGRLHEEKGHAVLFGALPAVQAAVGNVQVLLAGIGPHRAQLEHHVRRSGLEECVRFIGWQEDVASLIGLADVVVQPSLAESFGLALVEAMGLGKPVVGSSTGGIPEVISDGETGLIFPSGNAAALGAAIVRILSDAALAARLGAAGKTRALTFESRRMMEGYERVYRLIAQPAPQA